MIEWKSNPKKTKVYMAMPTTGKTYFCNKHKDRVYNGDCFMIKYGEKEEIEDLKGSYQTPVDNWEDHFAKELIKVIKSGIYEVVMLGLPNQGKLDLIYKETKNDSEWSVILPTPPHSRVEDLDYLIQRAKQRGNSKKWLERFQNQMLEYLQSLKDFAIKHNINIKFIEKGKYLTDIEDELF